MTVRTQRMAAAVLVCSLFVVSKPAVAESATAGPLTPREPMRLVEKYRLAGKDFNPLAPSLGLKTYVDLGIMVEETLLGYDASSANPVPPAAPNRSDTDTAGGLIPPNAVSSALVPMENPAGSRIFPLSAKGCQIMIGLGGEPFPFKPEWQSFDNANTLWYSYSKDRGHTWSEPRFVAALVDASEGAAIRKIALYRDAGHALRLSFENHRGRRFELKIKERELCRMATVDDLRNSPLSRLVLRSVPRDNRNPYLLADSICIGQDIAMDPAQPPAGYKLERDLGLVVHGSMNGQVVHTAKSPEGTLFESRAVVTPKGDYLVFIPDGSHANSLRKNANILTTYRSSDQGVTWQGPSYPFGEGKHYGPLPLVPRGSNRIYVYESLCDLVVNERTRGRTFVYRCSDDDGRSWSPVQPIRLDDGSYWGGLGVIPMAGSETDAGTLMAGFHHARIVRGELGAEGRRWSVATWNETPEPNTPAAIFHMDELQVIGLEGPNVLAVARTNEGHVWEMRSSDDGKTWQDKKPTPLVHPDAPPMVFRLSDGHTLIALHHNRAVMRSVYEPVHSQWMEMPSPSEAQVISGKRYRHSLNDWVSRSEVWCSISRDGGRQWSKPQFMFANAFAETLDMANPDYQCSYMDLFVDKGVVHLIIPHRWQRVVHLAFPEDKLDAFSTKAELTR